MAEIPHPGLSEMELPRVLDALADPIRLRIVAALAEGELCCGDLPCALPRSTLSHHIKVLRDAGVIRQRESGTARITSLRRRELDKRFPGLMASILKSARCENV